VTVPFSMRRQNGRGHPAAPTRSSRDAATALLNYGTVRPPAQEVRPAPKVTLATVVALSVLGALSVLEAPEAAASTELAAARNCLGCHHAVQRRAGPSFKAIADRYREPSQGAAREATLDLLARKIRSGGKGSWGVVPMPSHPQVSEADARRLAAWILDQHR
jgi:cytochrome c